MNEKHQGLISLRATANRLGITENALRAMVYRRTAPPSAVVGRRRMFRPSDVDAYIADAFEHDRYRPLTGEAEAGISAEQDADVDRLMTLRAAADRLGVTENSLRSMVHGNTAPPSSVIGRRRMFRESDLVEFIAHEG